MLGSIDTPEKFQAKRHKLAEHEWARMRANNSQECRNCHNFESMDLTEQGRRAAATHPVAFGEGHDLHRLPQGHRPPAAADRAGDRRAQAERGRGGAGRRDPGGQAEVVARGTSGFNETAPKTRPSELFQRNCWISFEPVESGVAVLADYIGPHKIMRATDYPHSDSFSPGAPEMLSERLGSLSSEAKHPVHVAGGALGFYGLS